MMRYKQEQRRPKRVINRNNKRADERKPVKASSSSNGFYYSFLTVVLLLCLVQITISAVLNISKIVSYKAKIVQITKTRNAAKALNEQLQDNIKNFSNVTGLEAIARNNLKMSGEDEVLVIINTKPDETKEEKEIVTRFMKLKNMIKILLQEGFALKDRGHYKHAIEVFYKALEEDNTSTELLFEIADLYYRMQNEERALNYIEQILDRVPEHITALKLLEKIFIDRNALAEAEQTAKISIVFHIIAMI